jgi:fido (protein-threonine AMPylation protein)
MFTSIEPYAATAMTTEIKLKLWRGGQTAAERLAGNVLHLDGFSSLDPQCPLGGPDGIKDIICEKNGWKYIGAAYFPPTEQTPASIQKKYLSDLDGVATNEADGLVFITNQAISPAEREKLVQLATSKGHKSLVYHLERIRLLLDSPSGYGIRLEFLDIDMSKEEQLSFFSQWNRSFSEQIKEHGLMIIRELSKKIDSIREPSEYLSERVNEPIEITLSTAAMLGEHYAKSAKDNIALPISGPASKSISIETLCMLHRALLIDYPHGAEIGVLRKFQVWIGPPKSTPETATYIPPPADQVLLLTEQLLSSWRIAYDHLASQGTPQEIITKITEFHHRFLNIHPFSDGNGRLARFLLMQQANELLNHSKRIVIEDRKPYFDALVLANSGNISTLESIITQSIFGVEFVPDSPCQMSGQPCPSCGEGVMDVDVSQVGVLCSKCSLFIPAIQ